MGRPVLCRRALGLMVDRGRPGLGLDGPSREVLVLWAKSLELNLGGGEELRAAATKLEVVRLSGRGPGL